MTVVSLPKRSLTLLQLFLSICLLLLGCTKKNDEDIAPYAAPFWIKGTIGENPLKWEQNKSGCRNSATSLLDTNTCPKDTVANQSILFTVITDGVQSHEFKIRLFRNLPDSLVPSMQPLDSVLYESAYPPFKCTNTKGFLIQYEEDGQDWTNLPSDTAKLVITKIIDETVFDSFGTTTKVVEGTYKGTLVDIRNQKRTRKISFAFRSRAISK